MAVSSPMIYTNGEVIGVLRYVTSLRTADKQVLMIGLIAVVAGLIFVAVSYTHLPDEPGKLLLAIEQKDKLERLLTALDMRADGEDVYKRQSA